MRQQREITILVQCHDLPGVRSGEKSALSLGIQKGREVVDDVLATGSGVTFTATLRVGGLRTEEPNFLGPYAHGKPDGRFLYLCWGERTADGWDLSGRAKIPLTHLSWDRLDTAWEAGEPITIPIAMTDAKGRRGCGTILIA